MVPENSKNILISAPKMQIASFEIIGNAPLVLHRFSQKAKRGILEGYEEGKSSKSKKTREAKSGDSTFNEARYISKDGWDGFNASSIRCAMVSACRLVDFKMTLAKMSIFVIADGWDKIEPQIPLIRIFGSPKRQDDTARLPAGGTYVTIRPAYYEWRAVVTIRFDADQFSLADITNLLLRVGQQVGIGEGRPDSKKSTGMGWGTFDLGKVSAKK